MSESAYRSAYEAGYRMGLGDGVHETEAAWRRRAFLAFCAGLAALPLWKFAEVLMLGM